MRLTILFLLCALPCFAQYGSGVKFGKGTTLGSTNGATGGGATLVLLEEFEDASVGWDNNNANGWVPDDANSNPLYATSPAPLVGTHSCSVISDSKARADFTAQSEVWCKFTLHTPAFVGVGEPRILLIYNGATALVDFGIDHANTDRLHLVSGTGVRTAASMLAATTYDVWVHYLKGTGANAVIDVEFQTTGTPRVGSGNNFCQLTDATATADASRIWIITDGTERHIYDSIKVSSTGYP